MTDQRKTIRPGPLPRDGTIVSRQNCSGADYHSGGNILSMKAIGMMQGSGLPYWYETFRLVEEKSDGRSVPIRDGTNGQCSYNLREGPHRYLAHRRLQEIDRGSSPPCRDGTTPSGVEKPGGRSVPIRNGTKSEFAYNLLEGPHRYLAQRLLIDVDEGNSPPVRDGTCRDVVEKSGGRGMPVWFGGRDDISNIFCWR